MQESEKCQDCWGWGEIIYDDIFGFSQSVECKTCNGTWKRPQAIESNESAQAKPKAE